MEYISTTDLRTKSSKLRDSLLHGDSTYLVHRSKVIGIIIPSRKTENTLKSSGKDFVKFLQKVTPGKRLSFEERNKRLNEYFMEEYGTGKN